MSHTEIELKAVVPDWNACRARAERGGARLVFSGRLEDRRYDTPQGTLAARDHVLRVRTYRGASDVRTCLAWKGPTRRVEGYKEREEMETSTGDPAKLAAILERLGYVVTHVIERDIVQYEWDGVTLRFEHYPRMDDLVEVEGSREAIERAIALLEIPRADFTGDRLVDFALRFERRTGCRAALSNAALDGHAAVRTDDV